MRVFQDLTMTGTSAELLAFAAAIESRLSNGWTRNTQREQEVGRFGSSSPSFCFACDARAERKAGDLWLSLSGNGNVLRVGNIVPSQQNSLSYDEYNHILNDFYNSFVQPHVPSSLRCLLSPADVTLEDFASRQTAERLRSFSRQAHAS